MLVRAVADSRSLPAPSGVPSGSSRYLADLEDRMVAGTSFANSARNDEKLWREVQGTLTNLLTNEWRAGRLQGSRPEEAYFVHCDRSTMSQADIDAGRLICLVGVATRHPAEFANLRIQQRTLLH
jgi:phage tail sheath protein FI